MAVISVLLLGCGLALLAVNTRQRLGRTRAARSWVRDGRAELGERNVLVMWPLLGAALLLAGALRALDGVPAAATTLALLLFATLVLWLAYAVLPLPVPRWVQPQWYRQLRLAAAAGDGRG